MKILVLGAGATGGYFGGRLAASGADVTFLVRPKRAAQLAEHGIVIESPFGNGQVSARTVTAETLHGPFDLIILSCKSYDLETSISAIAPAVGANTQILPLLNGLAHLDDLDQAFGAAHVLGGLCHLSVNLTDDGRIQHLNTLHLLTFGPRQTAQQAFCNAVLPVLQKANFATKLSGEVIHDMWGKWVLLASLAGMTCLMRASVGEIATTRDGASLMHALIDENAAIAAANGAVPRPEALATIKTLLTDTKSAVVASMLRDIQKGARIEGDHIIGDLLARGAEAGIASPLLRIAYANLEAYQNQRAASGV
jgi:2-dehydropantoate 2-reductase